MQSLQLNRIELNNFGSYVGRHAIPVTLGTTYVTAKVLGSDTVDSNTGGKTTVLNAICWGLYGKKPNKSRAVTNDSCTQCEVILQFNEFTVHRIAGRRSSVEVRFVDGTHWKGDKDEVQARLERFLGISYNLFITTCFIDESSESVRFIRAEPAQRAGILGELVDSEIYATAGKLASNELRAVEGQILSSQSSLFGMRERLSALEAERENLKVSLASFKAAWLIKKKELLTQIQYHEEKMRTAQVVLLKKPRVDPTVLNREYVILQERNNAIEEQIRDLGTLRMPSLSAGEVCPTCMRVVSADALSECHAQIKDLRDQAVELKRELGGVKEAIISVNEQLQTCRLLKVEKEAAKREFENQRVLAARLQEEVDAGPPEAKGLEDAVQRNWRGIEELRKRIEGTQAELVTLTASKEELGLLATIFTKEIRNYLFDRLRNQLAYYTDFFLKQFYGSSLRITYPSTSGSGREKFEVDIITPEGKSRDFRDCSKGEGLRASFAVLLALRQTMLANTSTRLQLLMVDDPFGSLDDTGIEQFLGFFHQLGSEKSSGVSQLLVTVPRNTPGQSGDAVIRIEQKNGCSRFLC